MSTPGTWSAGQRALLRFVEREGLLAAPVDPPTDAPVSDDALFALLDTVVEQTTLAKRLAERLRLPLMDVDELPTDAAAAELLKADVAQRCGVVVLSADERTIEVASANPLDLDAVKTVEFAAGRRARVSVTTRAAVQRGLARLYGGDHDAIATESPEEPVAATPVESREPASPAATGEIVWTLEETDDPLPDATIADEPVTEPGLAAPAPEVVDELPSEPLLSEIAVEPIWTLADETVAAPSPAAAADADVSALLALLEASTPPPPVVIDEPPTVEEPPADEPAAALTSDAAIELAISALLVDSPPVAASNGAATDTVWSVLEELLVPEPHEEPGQPAAVPTDDPTPAAEEPSQPEFARAAQLAPLATRVATLGATIDEVRHETMPRLKTLEEAAEHWSRVATECLAIPRLQDGVITAQHAIADLRTAVGQLRDEAVRHATAADHGLGHRLDALDAMAAALRDTPEAVAELRRTIASLGDELRQLRDQSQCPAAPLDTTPDPRVDRLAAEVATLARDTPEAVAELRRTIASLGDELHQLRDESQRPSAPVDTAPDPRVERLAAEVATLARDTATRLERMDATIDGLATVRDAVAAVPGTIAGLQHQVADIRERTQAAERRLTERFDALAADLQRWRDEAETLVAGRPDDTVAAIGTDVTRLRQELERTADDVHRLSVAAAAQIAGAEDRAVAVERMRAEVQQLRDEAGRRGETFETRLASRVDDVVKALKAESLIARDVVAEQLTRIEGRIGALEADAQATRAERQGTQGTVELALAQIHSELSALHQRRNGRPPVAAAEDPEAMLSWLVGRVRSQLSSELTTLGRLGGVIVQFVRSATPSR